jgi:AcrR family transcriptional regulator
MPKRLPAITAPRKKPKQARSAHLVDSILKAAIRVLEREGATAFTTIRVAEQAGVSVGSLYQYFPNKESILFRLQQDEWVATGRMLDAILTDASRGAAQRLRDAMRAFFRSEYDEAPLRRALGDAAPLYRDAPQAKAQRERGLKILVALIAQASTGLSSRQRAFAAELYIATMSSMGKHVSETAHSRVEVDAWSAAIGDMFLAYLPRARSR